MAVYSLATALWGSQPTFDEVIEGVATAGFDQCELAAWTNLNDQLTSSDRRRSLNKHGVWARTIHPQISDVDLSAPDEETRNRSIETVAACFAPFAELGGFAVIIHPTGGENHRVEDAELRVISFKRSLDSLLAKADAVGIRLACENLQLKGEPRPLCRMSELRKVVDEYPPTIGLCLDTGHANNNALDAAEEAKIAGNRLIALHLQDTDGIADRHWVPGAGSITWNRLHASLTEIEFVGARTFELKEGDVPAVEIASIARQVADAWDSGRFTSNLGLPRPGGLLEIAKK